MSNNLTFRLDSETERMLNELVNYWIKNQWQDGGIKYEEDNNDSK